MKSEPHEILIKICFTGKSGVGKTSLLTRESHDMFTEKSITTIGVDFAIKKYKFGNIIAKAQIWDTAGQERFRSIQIPYFRGKTKLDFRIKCHITML